MNLRFRQIARLCCIALAGCAANEPAPVVDMSSPSTNPAPAPVPNTAPTGTYRVMRGDTLYAIAFKHGLDYRDLAAWNGIAAPYRILVGQDLRLSAPAHVQPVAPSAPVAVAAKPPAVLPEPAPGAPVTAGISDHTTAAAASAFEDVPAQPQPLTPPAAPAAAAVTESSAAVAEIHAPAVMPPPKPAAETPKPATPPAVVAGTTSPPTTTSKPPVIEAPRAEATPELNAGGVRWRWPSDGKVIGAYVSGEPTKQGVDIGGKAGDPVRAAADGEVVYSGNGLIGYGELIIVKHNANFLSAYGHNRSRLVKEGEKVKAGQAIAEMGASASARDELHFEIRKNGKPVNPLDYLPAR